MAGLGTWALSDALETEKPPKLSTVSATVKRVDDDGTAWVTLGEGAGEFPATGNTAEINPGDTVSVRIQNGTATIGGNVSAPSAGVAYVRAVEGIAQEAGATAHVAVDSAKAARQIADEAQKVAEATNQHFFADDNGAHVTDVTQDEWAAAVDDDFSDYDPDTKPYHNQLLNSLGILLRTALNNLVSITRSAIAFYDGTGNAASNIVARFGSDGAQIGQDGKSHLELDYHSMRLIDEVSGTYLHVSDLRDSSGEVWYHKRWVMNGHTTYISVSPQATNSTYQVYVYDENSNDVTGNYTITKGASYIIINPQPAAGYVVRADYKSSAMNAKVFTFGSRNNTEGDAGGSSSSFGFYNVSQGESSFASGWMSKALGKASHAFGTACEAATDNSTAFGAYTKSSALYAHAQNYETIAASESQTAMGKYNVADYSGEYALIIGNGTGDSNRSNAFAVDWDGGIYVDDHDSPIGTVLETGQVTYSGAMVANTMKQGASLSLTSGTWLLVGLFTFGTASTTGTRNISCDLFQGTVSGTTVCRQRVVSAAANESFLQAIGVVNPTATTSYSIGGSSSVATNQARYSSLTAVRIA